MNRMGKPAHKTFWRSPEVFYIILINHGLAALNRMGKPAHKTFWRSPEVFLYNPDRKQASIRII
jgi:hypothetical protein